MIKANHTSASEPLLLSVDAAGDTLGVSKWTLYTLMQSGQLKSVKLGSRRLIARDDLDACMESLRASSGALHDD